MSDNYDWNIGGMQLLDIENKYDFFNPKAGINYEIDRKNRLFASWSVAHKEPTRNNFIDRKPDREPVPERMFDYELGYSYSNSWLSAGVNLYYMDYKNQLVATGQLSDTGNPVSENVPDSYRMGIELQLGVKPLEWFNWQINATISRNRIENFTEYIYEDEWTNPITVEHGNTTISFSPDFVLNNAFNFKYRNFDASIQSHYVSKQYLSNSNSQELMLAPYFVSNLYLGYTFSFQGVENIRVGFNINNIFNEEYESNGYARTGYTIGKDGKPEIYRIAGYAVQAPINVMGTVSIKF